MCLKKVVSLREMKNRSVEMAFSSICVGACIVKTKLPPGGRLSLYHVGVAICLHDVYLEKSGARIPKGFPFELALKKSFTESKTVSEEMAGLITQLGTGDYLIFLSGTKKSHCIALQIRAVLAWFFDPVINTGRQVETSQAGGVFKNIYRAEKPLFGLVGASLVSIYHEKE
jgi:hypothetical protein